VRCFWQTHEGLGLWLDLSARMALTRFQARGVEAPASAEPFRGDAGGFGKPGAIANPDEQRPVGGTTLAGGPPAVSRIKLEADTHTFDN